MASFLDELDAKFSVLEELPTLPSIITELERILHNDAVSAAEVAVVIEEDPAIAASVLRVANSVMFLTSQTGSIATIRDAVVRLGFNEVQQIVSAAAFIRSFGKLARRVDPAHFWRQSLTTAVAGRAIIRNATQSIPFYEEEAYVAGLLHDIGLLILDQYFSETYDRLDEARKSQDGPWAEMEREVLGLDHGQIGGHLLNNWNVPETLVQAVTWHNQPDQAGPENQLSAEVVLVAELVTNVVEAEHESEEPMQALLSQGLWTRLGIPQERVATVVDETKGQSTPAFALV